MSKSGAVMNRRHHTVYRDPSTVDRGPWTVDLGPWTVDRGPLSVRRLSHFAANHCDPLRPLREKGRLEF